MTERMSFSIRRALLLPLGSLLLVQLGLLVLSLLQGQPSGKIIFLGGVVVLLAGLMADNLFRRIELDEEGITVCRMGRKRRMLFADLTEVEAVCLRKRLFVTLWVGDTFLLVTNAYGGVATLFERLLQRVPSGLVSDDVKELVEAPPSHNGNIIVCWFAVVFSLLILCQQLGIGG